MKTGMMKAAFVTIQTLHGFMIVPRNDFKKKTEGEYELGVGANLLEFGHHDLDGIAIMANLLTHRREKFGDGAVMIDAGANIGTVTLTLGRFIAEWGRVMAFEPQDRIFMALCGNVMLNNLTNIRTYRVALGREDGMIEFPVPDYELPANYGGIGAIPNPSGIGQEIKKMERMPVRAIDSFDLPRLDFLKLDVEGMEIEALIGGKETIERCRPDIFAEWIICGKEPLKEYLHSVGYQTMDCGMDMIACPGPNPVLEELRGMKEMAA